MNEILPIVGMIITGCAGLCIYKAHKTKSAVLLSVAMLLLWSSAKLMSVYLAPQ